MKHIASSKSMVLIIVLWTIAVLSLLAGGLCFALRQNIAISNIEDKKVTAHCLARAGIERAIAEIMDDIHPFNSVADSWHDAPDVFQDVELEGGTFSVTHENEKDPAKPWFGAEDESAKLNLNTVGKDQLMKLPNMTSSIADAIIDWRDKEDVPEADGVEGGYYKSLPHPCNIRNGSLRTVRELLLVRGVTPELLFGDKAEGMNKSNFSSRPDRGWFPYLTVYSCEKNVNADGEKRLNIKTADAGTIAQRLSLEKWAAESIVKARENNKINHLVDLLDVQKDTSNHRTSETEDDINSRSDSEKNQPVTKDIFKRIIDDITLKDDETLIGRININTASSTVLKTLPGIDDDLTNAILRAREGSRQGFSTIADLLDLSDMKKEKFAGLEDSITVRSRVFRVKSTGSAASGLAVATIECVVDRNNELPVVLYWLESSP